MQRVGERRVEEPVRVALGGLAHPVEQLHARAEQQRPERRGVARRPPLRLLAEEVEVEAEVEDAEVRLVVARPEHVRAQPRAAPDHLPELDARVDRLEEHEVQHLGHVDAGVEHVDRDRDVRRLVGLGEVVDQALGVLRLVVDDAGEVPGVLRVVVVEALLDERRVAVVPREHDRLGEPVPALDRVAVRHDVLEHLVDGVGVEQPGC